jgi:serine protease Do
LIGDVRIGGAAPTVVPGKLVVLLTNPYSTGFRIDRPSGGLGSITNVRRRLGSPLIPKDRDAQDATNRSAYAYGAFLEHDAKLHAETSGAALVNLDGELIGLTTLGHAATGAEHGPGFAFPMDLSTRNIIEVLKRGEEVEYGYFGVSFDRRGGIGGRDAPLTLSTVVTRSPAGAAGLFSGDTITHIDGVKVSNYADLLHFGGAALAGTKLKIVAVDPDRVQKDLEITLEKYRHDEPRIVSVRPEPVFGLRVDYGSILAQTLANRNPFGAPSPVVPEGVCVRELVPDSPAAARFKTLGDAPTRWLITRVNGVAVSTPAAFYKAAKGQASVRLNLIDPNDRSTRELTIP